MPKGGRKSRPQKERGTAMQTPGSDFTVYDYVDVKSGRVKKGAVLSWDKEVKKMAHSEAPATCVETEDLAWYEKDLSDIEYETDLHLSSIHGDGLNSDEEVDTEEPSQVSCRRSRRCKHDAQEDTGVIYPIDVWFSISKYIMPEDVGRFAGICRGSHAVVHTAHFWTNLFQRYCMQSSNIPEVLGQNCTTRIHGSQAFIVRALYYTYPVFQERLKSTVPFASDPDCLEDTMCILMWYQQIKSQWHFFFKLRQQQHGHCPLRVPAPKPSSSPKRRIMMDQDIYENPEEDCTVLQIVTRNFIPLPMIMGLYLVKVCVSVGHGMRFHKVKLIFSATCTKGRRGVNSSIASEQTIIMDPVTNMHVLSWWDPRYPYSRNRPVQPS